MANDINIVVAAQVQGAIGPLQQVQKQVNMVDRGINQSTASLRRNASQYNATSVATNKFAKGALQQAGYQIGDFAVQVANGTSKMQAFGQQGSQMLGIFGPVGAVLGAGVAIVSAFAVAFERANAAGTRFSGDIQGSLGSLKSAYSDVEDAQERYNEAIAAAAVVQNSTSAAVIAALGRELQARQTLLRLQQAEYRIQREGAAANLESLNEQVQRLFDINQLFMRGGMIDNPISSAGQYLPAWKEIVEANRSLLLEQARSRAELQLVDSILDQINLALGETVDTSEDTAAAAAAIADQFERASRAARNINASAQNRLADLRAELALRGAGAGDEEVRVQQAIISARRQAIAEGITGARQLRIITAEAGENARQIIAAENALLQYAETSSSAGSAVRESFKLVTPVISEAAQRVEQIRKSIEGSMESAFMSMVDGTKSVQDAFRSMATEIIKELYRVLVVQRLVAMISGAIFGSPLAPASSSRPVMRPRALGGAISAGVPYMVGEKGPEMIVPTTSGRVIPNNQLEGGGQTINIVQNINVSTGVQQTVRAEIKQLMPQIAESAKSAVVDAKRRGGSYGRAFA